MRLILLVRHAKSSWDDISQSDFERPLNNRGYRDAPEMAKRLLQKNILPDTFVSSPAKRAKETAELFAKTLEFKRDQITYVKDLYLAGTDTFYSVIAELPDNANTVILFSHNPGITDFVNSLTNAIKVNDMPTCSIFAVRFEADNWQSFQSAEKEFLFFDYPKLHG